MVNFVLLAHERSGSTLVGHSLADQRSICMYGEIFHDDESERRRSFRAGDPEKRGTHRRGRFYRDGDDGADFLRDSVFFERYWKVLQAVGFKLFYHHARKDFAAKSAWQYLIENKRIHIVHLRRDNLLESFLSRELAIKNKEWVRLKGQRPKRLTDKRLSLDVKACERYFHEISAYRELVRFSFSDHPVLEIEYERDIYGRFKETMTEIQDFLSVPRKRARQLLEKQARRKPHEQVSNYAELKEYFSSTRYEEFFRF